MPKDGAPAIPYLWKGPAQVLKKTFKLLDADGSGTITDDEGYAAGRALHAGSVDAGRKYWDTMKRAFARPLIEALGARCR